MDRHTPSTNGSPTERHIANLKILSRLLSHELRAQTGPRLTLSREEMAEIQVCLDLFIEEMMRRKGSSGAVRAEVEVQTVPARMN